MDISAKLNDARLARSEAVSATATGQIRLTKVAGETALLRGNIVLPETRYEIIRQGAAQVPELTGVRFKAPKRQRFTTDEPEKPTPGLFSSIRLDLDLSAPERLYVSGMGLESEWRANFKLKGTSAAPVMTGKVELIRGTLGFAGRSFELSEGRVTFTGGSTIDPIIAIVASGRYRGRHRQHQCGGPGLRSADHLLQLARIASGRNHVANSVRQFRHQYFGDPGGAARVFAEFAARVGRRA